jgi:tetratricopeptide (TPR) repeat protein
VHRLQPQAELLHQQGILALHQEDFLAAVEWINQAIALCPTDPAMYCNRGVARQRLGDFSSAITDYEKAIALRSDFFLAYVNRGVACMENGDNVAALPSLRQALALEPRATLVHRNLGNALLHLAQPAAALAHYDYAAQIEPDLAMHHWHRGLALLQLDQFSEAQSAFQKAHSCDPVFTAAHCYLGETQRMQKQLAAANVSYAHALALEPNHADTRFFHSLALLTAGDWAQGWRAYEWRWHSQAARLRPRQAHQPLWLGQTSVQGQTVLVHAEQGLGDTLQFCRYLPQLLQRGAKVIVEVPQVLLPVLKSLAGDYEWIAAGSAAPPFDWHCPLLSLPLALGSDAPYPMAPPGYLQAPQSYLKKWRAMLPVTGRRRLGIAWSGNPLHLNDRHRSLKLADLLAYLPPDWDLFILQTEWSDADQQTLNAHPELQQASAAVQDFGDSAALCELMDLVLSVDTSAAHLGGALGRPTWLLLPWRADWRWGLEGDTTCWYPRMRLFRQPALNDWRSALSGVRDALTAMSSSKI